MSIEVTYKMEGMGSFIKAIAKKSKKTETRISQEINRSSLRVERKAKKYAAWDTGYMSMSIYSTMVDVLLAEVISPANYSVYVENGTSKMAAQPFLFPALMEEKPILMRNLKKIVGD